MDVKTFDSLSLRDFDNGGFLDDIRKALKDRDRLRALLEEARTFVKMSADDDFPKAMRAAKELLPRIDTELSK